MRLLRWPGVAAVGWATGADEAAARTLGSVRAASAARWALRALSVVCAAQPQPRGLAQLCKDVDVSAAAHPTAALGEVGMGAELSQLLCQHYDSSAPPEPGRRDARVRCGGCTESF